MRQFTYAILSRFGCLSLSLNTSILSLSRSLVRLSVKLNWVCVCVRVYFRCMYSFSVFSCKCAYAKISASLLLHWVCVYFSFFLVSLPILMSLLFRLSLHVSTTKPNCDINTYLFNIKCIAN